MITRVFVKDLPLRHLSFTVSDGRVRDDRAGWVYATVTKYKSMSPGESRHQNFRPLPTPITTNPITAPFEKTRRASKGYPDAYMCDVRGATATNNQQNEKRGIFSEIEASRAVL